MNWQAISFDWNQIRAFLATVDAGSFSGAARVLQTTQPTIGRQINGLEESLGITLFERTVRGPTLTQVGQELLEHVRNMAEAATMISMVASGKSQEVTGRVTVTSSDLMAASILPPILVKLNARAPGIRLEIVATSEVIDLSQREADIAIRHVRPTQPDLIARHIGDFRANFYASSEYLEELGRPKTARELIEHRFVGTSDINQLIMILQERGIPAQQENLVAFSDTGTAMWEMTRAGLGIALLPEVMGDVEPVLEKVLPSLPSLEFPVWLVTHLELRTSKKIRVAFDVLANELKQLAEPGDEDGIGERHTGLVEQRRQPNRPGDQNDVE